MEAGLKSGRRSSESRFAAYVQALSSALGHAERAVPFHSYCARLLLPGDRKGVEPMAARMQLCRVEAAHQSLHHFVAKSEWSDDTMLAAVRARPAFDCQVRADPRPDHRRYRHAEERLALGSSRAAILRAAWQAGYCQAAVSLSAANHHASLQIAYRLYLPGDWADDPERRAAAGVHAETVLADAGYGSDTDFHDGITEIGLPFVVGITSTTSLWPLSREPLPPKPWCGKGRPTSVIEGMRRINLSRRGRWRWSFQKAPGGG